MSANPQILIGYSTGYVTEDGDTWMMCLYENKASRGVIKLIGSRYDPGSNTCFEDIQNHLITCVPATRYNLKNLGRVLVRANSFNYGCIESFSCKSGEDCDKRTCTEFGSRVSIDASIIIRSFDAGVPPSPAGLTISPGNSLLNILWNQVNESEGGEVFAYFIAVSDMDGNPVVTGYTESGLRHATIGGLVNGNTYNIEVRAVSHSGIASYASNGTGTPSPVGGGVGGIEIHTIPEGAEIFINGIDQSKVTPAIIPELIPGDYDYRLVRSGYNDATGSVTVESGKTTEITVTLEKPGEGIGAGTVAAIAIVSAGIVGGIYYIYRRRY